MNTQQNVRYCYVINYCHQYTMAQMSVISAIEKNIKNRHQKKQTSADMHHIGGNINFCQN